MVEGLRPDFVVAFVLLGIAIILAAARLLGSLAVRIGQPRVVGEIVAGVLLGPSLLGAKTLAWSDSWGVLQCDASRSWMPVGTNVEAFTPRPETITTCLFPAQAQGVLSIIGQIALVLFMFLVGCELDFKSLAGRGRGILTVAVGVLVAPLAIGLAIGPVLHTPRFAGVVDGQLAGGFAFSLFLAAMLSVTAFPVMARILQEKGLTTSTMGAVGIAAAGIVTIGMFVMLAVAKGVNAGNSFGEHTLVFIGTIVYLGVMFGIVRPLLAPFGRHIEASPTLDNTLFVAGIIVALLSAYAADRIGINVIVGGFVAGAIMPARPVFFGQIAPRISEVTAGVLLPIFLAFSGLRTDFTSLGWAWLPGLALFLVAGVVAKWGAGAVAARLGGMTWAEGNVLGVLMNCRGLLVLVVALAASDTGVITPQMQVGGVLMALVTTAMTGPLFDRFLPAAVGGEPPIEEPDQGVLVTA